ncbi:MAG: hypothetical protein M3N98_05885 [Actinomycetota bacterium]|nr:hypothetical protein [Actinomycetota bacterium]
MFCARVVLEAGADLAPAGGIGEAGAVRPGTTIVLALILLAIFFAAVLQFVILGGRH